MLVATQVVIEGGLLEFSASHGYRGRPCLKTNKTEVLALAQQRLQGPRGRVIITGAGVLRDASGCSVPGIAQQSRDIISSV